MDLWDPVTMDLEIMLPAKKHYLILITTHLQLAVSQHPSHPRRDGPYRCLL